MTLFEMGVANFRVRYEKILETVKENITEILRKIV